MEIRHESDRQRFVADADGGQGTLDYRRRDEKTLDFRSTFVPRELRGHGIGAKLVLHGLDYAREHGLAVIPTCPFVERVIEDHPEYRDLVAERS